MSQKLCNLPQNNSDFLFLSKSSMFYCAKHSVSNSDPKSYKDEALLSGQGGSDTMRQGRRVSCLQELAIRTGKEEVEESFMKDENIGLFLTNWKRESLFI